MLSGTHSGYLRLNRFLYDGRGLLWTVPEGDLLLTDKGEN